MLLKGKTKWASSLQFYNLTYDEDLVIESEFGERMTRDEYGALTL